MSKLKQLNLVADLELKKERQLALMYQQAQANVQINRQKLSGLENYRTEYLHTIRQKAASGVDAKSMNQHHQFVAKLDKACEQQVHIINNAVLAADQRKKQWLTQQQKHKAILHLIDSKNQKAKIQAAKQEQKMFDELALQKLCRKASKV